MKKIFLILFILTLTLPQILEAKVYISEIMYDVDGTDTGREWLEIHNNSSSSIDLSTYYIYETNVAHKIVNISGKSILEPNSFAIIADNTEKFLLDFTNFSGNLFDSVFSLNNSGEELVLLDLNKNEIDKVSYSINLGANGTGNSLQYLDGVLITGNPTPGLENITESEDEDIAEESSDESNIISNNESTHSGQEKISDYVPKVKVKTGIGRNRTVLINTPLEFEVYQSDLETKGKYFWNFGDGDVLKKRKVEHIYKYKGEYNVVLKAFFEDYKNTSRVKVKVLEPEIDILQSSSTIEIKNKGNTEINIGDFELEIDKKRKKIQKETILSKGQSIFFDLEKEVKNIYLYYPNGKQYFFNKIEKF